YTSICLERWKQKLFSATREWIPGWCGPGSVLSLQPRPWAAWPCGEPCTRAAGSI
ncbi:unnamed protein product, partial [Bubo scandiacus]